MKRLIFYASALTAMLVPAVACNDDNLQQEIPRPEAEAATLRLTPEEISVLKTMDGQSPIISQEEAISIADDFLGKKNAVQIIIRNQVRGDNTAIALHQQVGVS